jgi:hypothetical protein
MSDEKQKKRARRPPRPKKPIPDPPKGRVRAYRLWCKEHAPPSARQIPIDPRISIKPGEAECEEPGCTNRAFWEY